MQISPSILGADFANLQREIESIKNSDYIHIDVMDGHFVPNISMGIPVVESIKKVTQIPLDVHLMITQPERYIERFIRAGADLLTFHIEATKKPEECIRLIRQYGARPAISIKPNTPVETIFPYLKEIDMVLVMTVEPGFGGQKLIPDCIDKCRATKQEILRQEQHVLIEADGGIGEDNLEQLRQAGVDIAVIGSAVFKQQDRIAAIQKFKNI